MLLVGGHILEETIRSESMKNKLIELLKDFCSCKNEDCSKCGTSGKCFTHREADYLLAKGVIIPPVMVNTFVYFCSQNKKVQEGYIERITINKSGMCIAVCYDGIRFKVFEPCDFGKTVFLTREEAEQALKEGAE